MIPALEVLIGVFFVFAVSSLAASALAELIEARVLDTRAKYLKEALASLLGSDHLREIILSHPLLKGLGKDGKAPKYIPTRTFALALIETLTRNPKVAALPSSEEVQKLEKDLKAAVQGAGKLSQQIDDVKKQELPAADKTKLVADLETALKDILAGRDSVKQRLDDARSAVEQGKALVKSTWADAGAAFQKVQELRKAADDATQARDDAESALKAAAPGQEDAAKKAVADAIEKQKKALEDLESAIPKLPLKEGVEQFLASLPESPLRITLTSLFTRAEDHVSGALASIEKWFDDGMDQVTGWYKRRSQLTIFLIGLATAVAFDLDAITITRALATDAALRTAVVAEAQEYTKAAAAKPQDQDAAKALKEAEEELKRLGLPVGWTADELKHYGLPEGWSTGTARPHKETSDKSERSLLALWILKVLGFLITALATSLGAPFWFDLLKRVMMVRAGLNPDEDSRQKSSKQKTAPA
ncbi:MAG TPA: hypothetical protein VND93_02460 [Myxococcales bacterium]|nr:hypothetical protein [Myxococcales bacterium]